MADFLRSTNPVLKERAFAGAISDWRDDDNSRHGE